MIHFWLQNEDNDGMKIALSAIKGNFSDFKNDLTDILIKNITPIGDEMGKLMNDQSYLVEILKQGSLKANEKAKNTINEVYDIVGLIR